jgi:hypothetical protein
MFPRGGQECPLVENPLLDSAACLLWPGAIASRVAFSTSKIQSIIETHLEGFHSEGRGPERCCSRNPSVERGGDQLVGT